MAAQLRSTPKQSRVLGLRQTSPDLAELWGALRPELGRLGGPGRDQEALLAAGLLERRLVLLHLGRHGVEERVHGHGGRGARASLRGLFKQWPRPRGAPPCGPGRRGREGRVVLLHLGRHGVEERVHGHGGRGARASLRGLFKQRPHRRAVPLPGIGRVAVRSEDAPPRGLGGAAAGLGEGGPAELRLRMNGRLGVGAARLGVPGPLPLGAGGGRPPQVEGPQARQPGEALIRAAGGRRRRRGGPRRGPRRGVPAALPEGEGSALPGAPLPQALRARRLLGEL